MIAIAHALRHQGPAGEEKRKREYRELIQVTRRILGDARRVLKEIDDLSRRRRSRVKGLCEFLQTMAHRVSHVGVIADNLINIGQTPGPGIINIGKRLVPASI